MRNSNNEQNASEKTVVYLCNIYYRNNLIWKNFAFIDCKNAFDKIKIISYYYRL